MQLLIHNIISTFRGVRLNRVVLPGLPAIIAFFLLQFLPINLFCQSPGTNSPGFKSDTGSIYSVFHRETEQYQPTQEIRKRKAIKSPLPKNWNHIPSSTADTLYIPGISDPGLPDSTAFRQAFLRAAGLATLATGCQGTYLSDLYFKTRFSTSQSRYEDLYRFTAGTSLRFREIRVVTSFRLKSKEIYLVLAIPKTRNRGPNQLEISGNLYNYNVNDVLVRRIDCAVIPSSAFFPGAFTDSVAFYQYNRNFSNIRNLRNQWGSTPDKYDYFYPGNSENNENFIAKSSSSCNYGLWIAMLHQVFDALNNYIFKYSEQTQTLNEQGHAVGNQLTREKTDLLLTFTINDINVNNNSLMVKIAISHEN